MYSELFLNKNCFKIFAFGVSVKNVLKNILSCLTIRKRKFGSVALKNTKKILRRKRIEA